VGARRHCAERADRVLITPGQPLRQQSRWRAHAMQHPAYDSKLYRQVNDALAAAALVVFVALILMVSP
jgi:hypothetical protein